MAMTWLARKPHRTTAATARIQNLPTSNIEAHEPSDRCDKEAAASGEPPQNHRDGCDRGDRGSLAGRPCWVMNLSPRRASASPRSKLLVPRADAPTDRLAREERNSG